MMRITVNGVRVDASVKKTILPEFWSAAKGKVLEKKRETILAEGVAERIIGLYALGNSTREISDWMEENLGNRVSAETISAITDRVLPEIKAWRSRSLESVYPIVWMDAIHYKVTDERGCVLHVQYIMCWVLTGKDIRSSSECMYQEMREQTSGLVY